MAKISKEEYETLKGLEDQWKWIARDEKETYNSFYSNQVMVYRTRPNKHKWLNIWSGGSGGVYLPEELFQFIKWEDEDPYSIQELIEEYETEQYIKESVELGEQVIRDHARKQIRKESEETKVKSKQELIDKWESAIESAEFYGRGKEDRLIEYMRDFLGDLCQLDEPEVTLDKAFEKVAESYPMTKEEIWRHLERLVSYGGKVTYGKPYIIDNLMGEYEVEETEVKKNIEWLKGRFAGRKIFSPSNDREIGYNKAIDEFSKYVDQLDEPKTTELDALNRLAESVQFSAGEIASHLEKLSAYNGQVTYGELDEPEEITYEDALKVIAENIDTDEFSIGLYLEALSNNEKYEFLTEKWIESHTSPVDDEGRLYVWKRDLQNAIVPKQELPVIPQFVAEWIEMNRERYENNFFSIGYDLYSNDIQPNVGDWLVENEEKFVRAWLDGFTVEEEQRYYALIKGHENIVSDDKYRNYCITDESLDIGDNNVHTDVLAEYVLSATKDEWENLGINDDNADFVEVEELEE